MDSKLKETRQFNLLFPTSLLMSMCISLGGFFEPIQFFKTFFFNSIFIFIINSLNWKQVSMNFQKLYGIPDYLHSHIPSQKFAGIPLKESDPSIDKSHFSSEVFSNRRKVANYIKNILLIGLYYIFQKYLPTQIKMNPFFLALNFGFVVFLINISYWGQYLFAIFASIILLAIKLKFDNTAIYIVFFIYICLFFYCISVLTSWYWAKLGCSNKVNRINEVLKQILPTILIFMICFLLCDFFISPKNNFIDIVFNKALEARIKNISRPLPPTQVDPSTDLNHLKNILSLDKTSNALKKQLNSINVRLKKISNGSSFTKEKINEYKKLLKEQKSVSKQLSKSIKSQIKNEKIKSLSSKFDNSIEAFSHVRAEKLTNKDNIVLFRKIHKQLGRLSELEKEQNSKSKETIIKLQKEITTQIQKLMKNSNGERRKSKNELIKSAPEIVIKKAKNAPDAEKKLDTHSTRKKQEPRPHKKRVKRLKKIDSHVTSRNKRSVDYIEKVEDTIKENTRTKKKILRIIGFVLLFIILIFLFELYSKRRIFTKKERLSQEQITKVKSLLSEQNDSFKDIKEEIDFKFKQFYRFLSIVFYSPNYPPPPAMLIDEIENISIAEMRKVGSTMSYYFNLVHYEDFNKLTKKDIKTFRSSYKAYLKQAKNFP